jgi:hypothetical protein
MSFGLSPSCSAGPPGATKMLYLIPNSRVRSEPFHKDRSGLQFSPTEKGWKVSAGACTFKLQGALGKRKHQGNERRQCYRFFVWCQGKRWAMIHKEQKMKSSFMFVSAIVFTTFAIGMPAFSAAQTARNQPPAKDTKKSLDLPKCTESISTLPFPNGPHGLFALMFPDKIKQAKTTELLVHNPVVCGANFYLVWNRIDRGPDANPRYDWSAVDQLMAPWIAAGKQVNLIGWATGYSSKVVVTPDYVFAKVPSVECPAFGRVPVFWDKGFMTNYQAFMAAAIHRYENNPSVGYIRFGLGGGGETYPACMYGLQDKGFSPELWRKYILEMLDYEKSLNSPKQLMVGINTFGQPEDLEFAGAVSERAVRNGIAIGSQALSIEDIHNHEKGVPCHVDWCANFEKAQGKVPLELQTLEETNPDRAGPIGSMVDLLPFAMQLHTQIFEIYPEDWYVAYDPSDPDYAQHHEEYQRAYEAAAKILGGN